MIRLLKYLARIVVLIAAGLAWVGLYSWIACRLFYPPGTPITGGQAPTRIEWGLFLSTGIVFLLVSWLLTKLLPSSRPLAAQTQIVPTKLRAAASFIFISMLVAVFIGQRLIHNTQWGDAHYLLRAVAIELGIGALAGIALYRRLTWARTHEPPQVWFSTERQFEAFRSAIAAGNWWRKFAGRYPIADGAAYASALPWMKTPLVLVARGELAITEAAISFSPVQGPSWSKRRYHNVVDGFRFEIALSDIISIVPEEAATASPTTDKMLSDLISKYSLPWTRVVTSRPAPLDEFFLAVGGRNRDAMQTYRELSLDLRNNLVKAIGGRGSPTQP